MNLQNLCLNVIVCEFELFMTYINSDNANLKREFEFLQRVYSNEIASSLFEKNTIMPKYYIDVLVNKYLTTLSTYWLEGLSWETIVAKFVEIGSNLECIYFKGPCRRPWEDIICNLPNLQIMSYYSNCNDEVLKGIAKFCPNIVEINVTYNRAVTNTGIKYLCMKENGKMCCPKLKKINIDQSGVTMDGVVDLIKNLPSLEETDYCELPEALCLLYEKDLSRLDKIPAISPAISPCNITSLCFHDLRDTDILKICFTLCPHLKSFYCIILEEEHLELLYTFNELEKLNVGFNSNYLDINNFLQLKGRNLTSLSLQHCSLSLFNVVKSCPCLIDLYLTKVNFQNSSDISPLFEHSKADVSASSVYGTAQSKSSVLEKITFKQCNFGSSEFRAEFFICFEHCPIKEIEISNSNVEMKFLKDILLNCYSLKKLFLYICGLYHKKVELRRFSKVLPNHPEIDIVE